VLLVVGLLGGGLVSLLLLNTILAQGAFTMQNLQQQQTVLSERKEALEQQVAVQSSPEVLAKKARALGMVPRGRAAFLDAQSGKVYGRMAPGAAGKPRSGSDAASATGERVNDRAATR
jgi:hypothetical protein